MVTSTLTAIALVWTFGQHAVPAALSTLQAIPAEEELVDPTTTRPDVIEPPAIAIYPAMTPVTEPTAAAKQATETISETTAPIADPTITDPIPPRPLSEPVRKELNTLPPSIQPRRYQEVQARVPAGSTEMMTRHIEGTNGYAVFIERARTSLSSAKTASGRFTQANADGSIYGGTFALSRPGKLRFDYDAPVPVLIVSDGTTVAMEDSELETIDRIPLGATPLGLILDDDLRSTDDIIINSVIERETGFEITVEDATGEMAGTLTMLFDKTSNALTGWRTVDAELNMTRVSLSDVETNQRINPRQFILRDAEDEEDER
ncbi:MAG: outer-membrane lipoprotein carrier protein LolA [Pseudomonadota bacterium]